MNLSVSSRYFLDLEIIDIQGNLLIYPTDVQQVHNAGHMVPMDQPKAALEMLRRWTNGQLGETSSESAKEIIHLEL